MTSTSPLPVTFAGLQSVAKANLKILHKHHQSPRTQILSLGALIGILSGAFVANAPLDPTREALTDLEGSENEKPPPFVADPSIQSAMGDVLWALCMTGASCDLDLRSCILKKVQLNARKYPVDLCKGKEGKYTKYSKETGITKDEGQSTIHEGILDDKTQSVTEISDMINKFSTDRLWDRFHTPRNLLLALSGEFGELAELFQWKGDGKLILTEEELDKVGQELADITIYLLRLSHVCSTPIGDLAIRKAKGMVGQM
jgi:dCTP diphosphatase